MICTPPQLRRLLLLSALAIAPRLAAQARTQITINDSGVSPENLTSSQDGTVYFGSTGKGTIYRASPGAAQADPWILASATGLTNVFGVLADDRTNTLWVCQNAIAGRGGAPATGTTAVRTFDLKSGAPKGTYPLPADAGFCNDIALAADGTAYITESFRGRVHRLRPNATALETWLTDAQAINAVDGIAVLADGAVYVNDFFNGKLFRIPVKTDGSPGTITALESSVPMSRPDGLRSTGPSTLVQVEGSGRLTAITVTGDRAEVRVVREGLTGATGVTMVGSSAIVLITRSKGVVVPLTP